MTVQGAAMPTGARMVQHLADSAGPAHEPAADMSGLAQMIRALLAVEARCDTAVRLGGNLFDAVITGSGAQARAAVALMDEVQDGCGPLIADPKYGWLYWLVPPGSADRWEPHSHAVCLGAPHTITLRSLNRTAPPGPYWLRPSASDRLVPTGPLREAVAQLRPEPAPHAALAAPLGIALQTSPPPSPNHSADRAASGPAEPRQTTCA
ncbi:hypothetical protein [Streptomyces sp. AC512_CC834]|uniref:hypothetical protein n=1 Tax=Streptomyces sp. AC512_CC834 TaxID=2823691 RepID=UPI0027E432A3|nr:hypothetical protein [Streptomyces sp. AC512_CC834]